MMAYFLHFAKNVCERHNLQYVGLARSRHFYRLGGGFSSYPFYLPKLGMPMRTQPLLS